MAEEIISCIEAKRQGLSYYFSGKACIQGHIGKRIVSSRGCSVCRIQIKRNWAKKNPTKVREQKNKTYLKYRDKYLQQYKERDLKHPLKKRAARATRKALKRGNGGIHTANDVSRIYRAQRGKCAYCRRKVGEEYHIDHIFSTFERWHK